MNRHPPYGDEPPAYFDHEASTYLSDVDSPTAAARQNGATMRLLPTSGDDGDLTGSPPAPSSYYQSDYDDSTPYVSMSPRNILPLFPDTFLPLPPATQSHALRVQFGFSLDSLVLWWTAQE